MRPGVTGSVATPGLITPREHRLRRGCVVASPHCISQVHAAQAAQRSGCGPLQQMRNKVAQRPALDVRSLLQALDDVPGEGGCQALPFASE